MVTPRNDRAAEEDVAGALALIYMESQLRNAEAAAAAAESPEEEDTNCFTHQQTSTGERSPLGKGNESLTSPEHKSSLIRKGDFSIEEDQPRKKVAKKQCRKECSTSTDGCSNWAVRGGVCKKHGAQVKVKLCSIEGCTTKLRKEEYVFDMEHRSNYAAVGDAQSSEGRSMH